MRVLIIGDFNSYISTASKIAHDLGAFVTHVENCAKALTYIRNQGSDIIFVDAKIEIKSFVEQMTSERCLTPIIAYGVNADPVAARRAILSGAKEYIPFPPDPELIGAILASISNDHMPFIAKDAKTLDLIKIADRIAPSDASVLITGESGTGKEVMSRYIHAHSRRSSKPFISINCAAIPETLLESELFGYEKGAFTGAVARRIGKFEEAMGGTLLLDEVTEMSAPLQAKLLRAIQERVIERIGSNKPIPVDIRILATSNRNLEDAIRNNTFREDLYYRLNVVSLAIPALRERPDDILLLADYFMTKYCEINGFAKKQFGREAKAKLLSYTWPGNIRELENIIHRSVLLSSTDVLEVSFQNGPARETIMDASRSVTRAKEQAEAALQHCVGRTLGDVERELIMKTLESVSGNRTHAARILGISIRTLRNKINEYIDSGYHIEKPLDMAS